MGQVRQTLRSISDPVYPRCIKAYHISEWGREQKELVGRKVWGEVCPQYQYTWTTKSAPTLSILYSYFVGNRRSSRL